METLALTDRQYIAPADSALSFDPPGDWQWSAWQEALASAPDGGAYLTGCVLYPGHYSIYSYYQEFEVGVGAAGQEQAISSFKSFGVTGGGSTHDNPFSVWVDAIPANARVAVRYRNRWGDNVNDRFALFYVAKPLSGTRLSTTGAIRPAPSGANYGVILTAPGSYWTWTSWGEAIASTSGIIDIISIVLQHTSSLGGNYEVEVGTGAAGNEVAVARVIDGPSGYGGTLNQLAVDCMRCARGTIAAGTRISLRARGTLDLNEQFYVWLHYAEVAP